jgi:hypothetical protein
VLADAWQLHNAGSLAAQGAFPPTMNGKTVCSVYSKSHRLVSVMASAVNQISCP